MIFTNRFLHRGLPLTVMTSIACFSLPAQAGGLYIGEFGQPNQGASRAGANAIAEDASTALQNPAGVMFLDKPKSMATALLIHAETKFDQKETFPSTPSAVANYGGTGAASDGGNAGGNSVGGAFFHAHPVNDKWGWGFAFGSLSGAVIDYDDGSDFAGRYWASEVELLTVSTTGSISYKFTDTFAASVHSSLSYGELDLDVYVPGVVQPNPTPPPVRPLGADIGIAKVKNGDDTVISFGASTLWQATDKLRLGAVYNSEIEYDFDSDLKLPPGAVVGANVELTYPQTIRTSATYDLNESLTLLGSVAWEDWSSFEDIPITTGMGGASLPRNWDDTWFYSVGLRWKPNNRYTYYTGIAFDTDPTDASDRTADMPMDEQIRLSGGVTYERDNGHKIGGVLTYADYGDADINNGGNRAGPGNPEWTVKGDYSTNYLVFLGLNYGW
jgi:long-chain fatty acid transport protein